MAVMQIGNLGQSVCPLRLAASFNIYKYVTRFGDQGPCSRIRVRMVLLLTFASQGRSSLFPQRRNYPESQV